VIFNITPHPMHAYKCPTCNALIGGVVFAKAKDDWIVESESRIIGWGGAFGEKIKLVKIEPEKHGLATEVSDVGQGLESMNVHLIVPFKGKLYDALDVGFDERPGSASCGQDAPNQRVYIQCNETQKKEYFDVRSDVQFKIRPQNLKFLDSSRPCGEMIIHNEKGRYTFLRGSYVLNAIFRQNR